MLNQVIQVKNMRWQAFAPCFLEVWLCKNFLLRGFILDGCVMPGKLAGGLWEIPK